MSPTERIAEFCRDHRLRGNKELFVVRWLRDRDIPDEQIEKMLPLFDNLFCHKCWDSFLPCDCEYREE